MTTDGNGRAINVGTSYLGHYRAVAGKIRPPLRLAFYSSRCRKPARLRRLCPRDQPCANPHDLYAKHGGGYRRQGNSIGVFWQQFMTQFKARGSMLLLVDMPATVAPEHGGANGDAHRAVLDRDQA